MIKIPSLPANIDSDFGPACNILRENPWSPNVLPAKIPISVYRGGLSVGNSSSPPSKPGDL